MKKIRCGLITSGGDAPGMNKIIFDLCYLFQDSNIEIILIKDGLKGLYNKSVFNCSIDFLHNISFQQSSIIGTSRFPEFIDLKVRDKIKSNIKELKLDKLIVIGGDGSYEASKLLINDIDIIFVPSTIDNDFIDNHLTLGYYSCLEFISKTIFNMSLSAKSHKQVHMIELMGNKSSELILNSSMILNDILLIDSLRSFSNEFKSKMCNKYKKEGYLVILIKEKIMSEQEKNIVLEEISKLLNNKVRMSVLGYTQRSCDVTLNDLLYSSFVSKFIFNNIDSIKNVIISYAPNEVNNIKTSSISIK